MGREPYFGATCCKNRAQPRPGRGPPFRFSHPPPVVRRTKRYGMSAGDYSALMLAARITLTHLSVYSGMNFSNSARELAKIA
jgi:hypothetical protein